MFNRTTRMFLLWWIKKIILRYWNIFKEIQFQMMLAWKAFQHVASYDSAVSEWLWKQSHKGDTFPPSFTVPLSLKSTLRYGENPHQKAAFYADSSPSLVNAGGIATAIQHHGRKCLTSYNNYLDEDAAWNRVSEFDSPTTPTCVVVKHVGTVRIKYTYTVDTKIKMNSRDKF